MTRNEKGKKVGLSLVYPPPHLYHILFELFKNSMRATVETHHEALSLPKIEVLLAKGEHDVSIRISDQVTISVKIDFHSRVTSGWRDTSSHYGSNFSLPRLNGTQAIF